MSNTKKLYQLSDMIYEAVYELKNQYWLKVQNGLSDCCYYFSTVSKDKRRFQMAMQRHWNASAKRIGSRIQRNVNDFNLHFNRFRELINSEPGRGPTRAALFAELVQIEQEYDQFNYDLKEKSVSVVTEPITLEEIYLGPFEIQLRIGDVAQLYTSSPYRVIALEPNPAGSDSSITHPHVSNDVLCEGDGHVPIRRAIEDGRLGDFFTIVTRILHTYNSGSPYVSLADWEGCACYECGYTVSEDDRYYCEACDRDFCSQCSTSCQRCDMSLCLGCAYECPECQEPVCEGCTAVCKECEETFCKDCLGTNGICKTCDENRKENDNEEQEDDSDARIAV